MITDLNVIENSVRTNPNAGRRATWTFKYLMENMAGENNPAEFTLQWLKHWEEDQVVNGQVSSARQAIRAKVIDPWMAASGGEELDLKLAPFKLLAIVNRMDLRVHDESSVTTGGEGRFVFGVLDQDGTPLPPIAGPAPGGFTVIFEYELVAADMRELQKWAHKWHNLGRYRIVSEAITVRLSVSHEDLPMPVRLLPRLMAILSTRYYPMNLPSTQIGSYVSSYSMRIPVC